VNTVEKRGDREDENNREADPVAQVNADAGEDDEHAGVGGMPHPAVEPRGAQGLRGVNRYVGAERGAEGEDGCAADGQAGDEQRQSHGAVVEDGAGHGGRVGFTVPAGYPD
jgi:hypothetical protein